MHAVIRDRAAGRASLPIVALATALVVLALSFCFLGAADDHMGMDSSHSHDICLSMLVSTVTLVLAARLPLAGWAVGYAVADITSGPLHTPAPPPKASLLS